MSDNYQGSRNMPFARGSVPLPVFVTDQDEEMEEAPATNLSNVADVGASSHEGGHGPAHGPGSSVEVSASNCRAFDSNPLSPSCSESSACGEDVFMDVTEIEEAFKLSHNKLTVRLLRRILSLMMVIVYKTDCEIAQKRKMKGLWDKRPSDWPDCVPFKDPNNGVKLPNGRHGQKPKQNELLAMFKFLKHKYLSEVTRVKAEGGETTFATKEVKAVKEEPHNVEDVKFGQENRYAVAPAQSLLGTPASRTFAIQEGASAGQRNASQPVEVRLLPLLQDQQGRLQQQIAQIRQNFPEAAEKIRIIESCMSVLVKLAKRRPSSEINIALNKKSLDVEAVLNRVLLSDSSYVTSDDFKEAFLHLNASLVRCIAELSQGGEVRRVETEFVTPQFNLGPPLLDVISLRLRPSNDPQQPDEKKDLEENVQIDPDAFLNSQEKSPTKPASTQEAMVLPDPKALTYTLKVAGEEVPRFESEQFELEHVTDLALSLEDTFGSPSSLPLPRPMREVVQMPATMAFNTNPAAAPVGSLMSGSNQETTLQQNILQEEAMEMDVGEPSGAVSSMNFQEKDVWFGSPF